MEKNKQSQLSWKQWKWKRGNNGLLKIPTPDWNTNFIRGKVNWRRTCTVLPSLSLVCCHNFIEEMDKRGIMELDRATRVAYMAWSTWLHAVHGHGNILLPLDWVIKSICEDDKAYPPLPPRLRHRRPPNIHSAAHQRWRLAQMSMLISVGAHGIFSLILNKCDILKHWLVHRTNYKIITTVMTSSSNQMPGCFTTARYKDVEIAAESGLVCYPV